MRDLLAKKLAQENYEIIDAVDGEDGLTKMKKEKPDLLLLDLMLPTIDGFELLRRAKKDSQLANIPVLVLSNLGEASDIERAKEFGVKDYLVKANFTTDEILDKVKSLL